MTQLARYVNIVTSVCEYVCVNVKNIRECFVKYC